MFGLGTKQQIVNGEGIKTKTYIIIAFNIDSKFKNFKCDLVDCAFMLPIFCVEDNFIIIMIGGFLTAINSINILHTCNLVNLYSNCNFKLEKHLYM